MLYASDLTVASSCSCKRVRYCTRKCQKKHWKDGGHKKYCQAFPAVAAEMGVTIAQAVAAINPVTNAAAAAPLASTDIEPLDPGAACWICLDGDEPGDFSLAPSPTVLPLCPHDLTPAPCRPLPGACGRH